VEAARRNANTGRGLGRHARVLAIATIVAWFIIVSIAKPARIQDEWTHTEVIAAVHAGDGSALRDIPMPPGFHLLAAGVTRVFGYALPVIRGLNAIVTIAALLLLDAAARRRDPIAGDRQILLLAWSPLYLPYAVLAYTEPLSLLAICAALLLHVRRQYVPAAIALLLACGVRQSNIVWPLLFIAWLAVDALHARRLALRRGTCQSRDVLRAALWPHALPYLAVLAIVAGALALWRDALLSPNAFNRAGFNIAQFYLIGLVVALVGMPVWVARLRSIWRRRLTRLATWATLWALLIAAVVALDLLYDNPHPWNFNPNFLHDRVVALLFHSRPARWTVAGVLILLAAAIAEQLRTRPQPWHLIVAGTVSLLYLAPHGLVDHRYYILPLLLLHFFARYRRVEADRLCLWNGALTLATLAYFLAYAGKSSGL
jgi:hypothetical protein